jgi:hypothetical protein
MTSLTAELVFSFSEEGFCASAVDCGCDPELALALLNLWTVFWRISVRLRLFVRWNCSGMFAPSPARSNLSWNFTYDSNRINEIEAGQLLFQL